MKKNEIPIWNKYCLTIKEASEYFNIGRDTLYKLIKNPNESYILRLGRTTLIKREKFEEYLNSIQKIS